MRWWDGAQWTEHTHARPQAAPPAVAVIEPIPTRTVEPTVQEQPEREGYVPMSRGATGNSGYSSLVRGAQPFRVPEPVSVGQIASPHTLPIWLFALSPVPVVVLGTLTYSAGIAPYVGFFILNIFAVWSLVIWDYYTLRKRGFHAASPLWLFLGALGYLIAREVMLRRDGARPGAPGFVYVLTIIAIAVGLGVLTANVHANTANTAARLDQFETWLDTKVAEHVPGNWTTSCPDDAPLTTVGATFVCQSGNGMGLGYEVTVTVLEGSNYSLRGHKL
jgi:hypothetical protein